MLVSSLGNRARIVVTNYGCCYSFRFRDLIYPMLAMATIAMSVETWREVRAGSNSTVETQRTEPLRPGRECPGGIHGGDQERRQCTLHGPKGTRFDGDKSRARWGGEALLLGGLLPTCEIPLTRS